MRIKLRDGKTAKAGTEKKNTTRGEQWLNCGPPSCRWEGKRKKKTKTWETHGKNHGTVENERKKTGHTTRGDGAETAGGGGGKKRCRPRGCQLLRANRRNAAALCQFADQPRTTVFQNVEPAATTSREAKRNWPCFYSSTRPPAHPRTRFSWRIYIMSRLADRIFVVSSPLPPSPRLGFFLREFRESHRSINNNRRRPGELLVCRGRESLGKKKRPNGERRPGDITGTVRENRFSGRLAETERAEPHQSSRAENNHTLLTTSARRIHAAGTRR